MKISASILSADFSHLADQIQIAAEAGVDWIHIDVMDGHFVPNISMGSFIVDTCRKITNLPLDVHLMISNPDAHLKAFIDAGANWVSVHAEANPNLYRTLQTIRELGAHPSVVVNPGTPIQSIAPVLEIIDMVLVMSVSPGFSGQKFISSTPGRIQALHDLCLQKNLNPLIEVDGGVTTQTLPACWQAGAQVFVAATSVFKYSDGIAAGIRALRRCID
jgi:ribulose-phosphate 3-epimerase